MTTAGYGGDVNGDGYADVILGQPQFGGGRGRALVFYGSQAGLATTPDALVEGPQGKRAFGASVRMLRDLDGDRFDDVYIGGLTGEGKDDSGSIYRGGIGGVAAVPAWTGIKMPTGVGDLNGDGFDDLAFVVESAAGDVQVSVAFGSPMGPQSSGGWVSERVQNDVGFGHSIACAGDVNGDGCDDLLIGALRQSGRLRSSGRAYLFLGSPTGPSRRPAWEAEYPFPARKDVDEPYEQFFSSGLGSAGDVNRDGFDDVVVGAGFADHGDLNEGLAFVFFGSPTGLDRTHGWWAESNHAFSLFGLAAGVAGDVNGDGFDDIIIGAPGAADGQINEGAAIVYHGCAKGLSRSPDWTMESDHSGEQLGTLAASAGDVNGDGFGDVFVFGPSFAAGTNGVVSTRGRAVVIFGGIDGLPRSHDWNVEKPLLTAVQQQLDFYKARHGALVYWGPGLFVMGAVTGALVFVQARLRRRLAAAIEENRQLAVVQERMRLARDVHDHLGAQLTQISLWTDIARSSAFGPMEVSKYLERISLSAKNAVAEITQLVWVMSPESDAAENFAAHLSDFVGEFLLGTGIEARFELPEGLQAVSCSMECRVQVLATAKEALNNIVRHSGASWVLIRLSLPHQRMLIEIEDNGCGFELPRAASYTRGRGLRNMRARVSEVGGVCKITSVIGQGTRIRVEVPVLGQHLSQPSLAPK